MVSKFNEWRYKERRPIDLSEVRLGVTRWTWVRIAFVVMWSGYAFGMWRIQANYEDDRHRQVMIDLRKDYDACNRGNDVRSVIRSVIELIPPSSGTDLTTIPGFSELDKQTQVFLINLRDITASQARSKEENNETFKDLAFDVLVLRDCEAEYPGVASNGF